MTKDWEPLREEIRRLYHLDGKPLAEVMRLVQGKHGFIASERAYRTQLKKWGYMKNRTQACPRPRKIAHLPSCSSQRPAASSNPEGLTIFPGEGSFQVNLHAFSALDGGQESSYLEPPPYLSSASVPVSELDEFGHGPQEFQFSQHSQDAQGRTQLYRAARNGDADQVRSLLEAGVAVDTQDNAGSTPLHAGVTSQNVEIVELLLRFGADMDATNNLGSAPLHLAISRFGLVNALLNHHADPSIQDSYGDTPLHLAIYNHNWVDTATEASTVNALLESGADTNRANRAGLTPFHKLLQQHDYTAGVLRAIQSFLREGASVHQSLPDGETPLEVFFTRSRSRGFSNWNSNDKLENEILRGFLAKGASVITPMPSGEPLISAFCNHESNRSRADRELGKEIFNRITPHEVSEIGNPLLFDVVSNHLQRNQNAAELVATLLQRGANPNHEDHSGKTSLLLLVQHQKGRPAVVESSLPPLLKHGANPWQKDFAGRCAIFEAAEMFPKERLVRMMLEADLRRYDDTDSPVPGHHDPPKSEHWGGWKQATRAVDWNESKELILREFKFPSNRVRNVMRECALGVLAEKHIRLAQGDQDEREIRRQYVATIIRDCMDRGITLDANCTDCLVELCL
ncbi:hypothetical protein CEP53_000596 [Fusarium sp. AF-6]|nr:hypothetical protein CEP53_000596 [Fusarium sp. AF-6]